MTVLYAKLVHTSETGKQHWYELSEPITKGLDGIDILKCGYELGRPPYVGRYEFLNEQIPTDCRMICTSIADEHAEKLVFRAFKLEYDGNTHYAHTGASIEGTLTWVIFGGDVDTIEPDENYLERLAGYNDMQFGGIVEEFSDVA